MLLQTTSKMERCNLIPLEIRETHWKQSGVALTFSKETQKAPISWKIYRSRIIEAPDERKYVEDLTITAK